MALGIPDHFASAAAKDLSGRNWLMFAPENGGWWMCKANHRVIFLCSKHCLVDMKTAFESFEYLKLKTNKKCQKFSSKGADG